MFKLNGKVIRIDRDTTFVIGEGEEAYEITVPAASLQDKATRELYGITDEPDLPRPDDSIYWVTQNEDGTYTAVPKEGALASKIGEVVRMIDAGADAIYSTALGNRATEYAQAELDAQAYKDAGYTGTEPHYVAAWKDATGKTAKWAADDILTTAAAWRTAQVAIRANRLAKKEAARKAADFAELEEVRNAWIVFAQAIQEQLAS